MREEERGKKKRKDRMIKGEDEEAYRSVSGHMVQISAVGRTRGSPPVAIKHFSYSATVSSSNSTALPYGSKSCYQSK